MITFIPLPKESQTLEFEPYNEDFRMFAISAHGGQEYAGLPYAFHLASVECILANAGYTDYTSRAVAWLHDIIEDTSITSTDVIQAYGATVAAYVGACTGEGANRKERNSSIYRKLIICPNAAPYKTADRIANMKQGILTKSRHLAMYISEFEEFSRNIRPLMVGERKSALLWTTLEDTVNTAIQVLK